jgi:uncharacterized protein
VSEIETLFDAIQAGETEKVESLLESNPELVNTKGPREFTPLIFSTYQRKDEITRLFLNRGATLDVFSAAALGKTDAVLQLVGSDTLRANAQSVDGWTPLHLAAHFGRLETVKALHQLGADIDVKSTNPTNNTPMHAAIAGGSLEVAEYLLDNGANVNARDGGQNTALHIAAQAGWAEALRFLLDRRADVNARNHAGESPLEMAEKGGHQVAVEVLRRNGAIE